LPRLSGQGVAHRAAAASSICQASEKRPLALNERPKSREETPRMGSEGPEVQPTFHDNNDACVRADHQRNRELLEHIPVDAGPVNHSQEILHAI
jgi:D-alanyl-D-alanine dipeptidase